MSKLTFAQLRETNVARCTGADGFNHPLSGWSFSDWVVALGGEIGEALNVVKKLNRVRDGIRGNDRSPVELRAALSDELADAAIYLDLLLASEAVPAWTGRVPPDWCERQPTGERTWTASDYGATALLMLGRVAGVQDNYDLDHQARLLFRALDALALQYGIDLGTSVVAKFNATSGKLGAPYRLDA